MNKTEKQALMMCREIGKKYGYGNVISYLKTCWIRDIKKSDGIDIGSAATNVSPYGDAILERIEGDS